MFSKKFVLNTALVLIIAAFFAVILIVTKKSAESGYKYKRDFFCMDTIVSVRSKSNVSDDIAELFADYNHLLDKNDEHSTLSRLNDSGTVESERMAAIIGDVLSLNEEYGSLTDISLGRLTSLWSTGASMLQLPSDEEITAALKTMGTDNIIINGNTATLKNGCTLDFGAVAKGAVLDECYKLLEEKGSGKTLVSTGSSMLFYKQGVHSVSIADPDGGVLADVRTGFTFLSTSGGYERYFEVDGKTYCHIIDPKTGCPTETDLTTVTVFCESGILSDFLSTAIFIDGSENIDKYLSSDEYKIFAADKNNRLYVSDGLEYEVCNEKYGE